MTMLPSLARRGLFALVLFVFCDRALASPSWDGTWAGGWENGDGVQIVIAGDKVIGVGRGMDYPEILGSEVSADCGMLVVWWIGGDGLLQRTGPHEATISMRERGSPVRSFTVRRD